MAAQARAGAVDVGAACLLAYRGIEFPTAEQEAGALLFSYALNDLHVLAADKRLKE